MICFAFLLSPLQAEMRQWTDLEGRTMEAVLKGVDSGQVRFERGGQRFVFPLAQLAEPDQEYITKWEEARLAREAEKAAWRKVHTQFEGLLREVRGRQVRRLDMDVLNDKDFFVFYYSASWCGPCVQFTPTLINFYDELKREYSNIEFILIPSDRSMEDSVRYHQNSRMPWPMLNHEDRRTPPIVRENATRGIPGLVLVNGKGEVLATTGSSARNHVMQAIRTTLEEHQREREG